MITRPWSMRTALTALAAVGAVLAGLGGAAGPVRAEPGAATAAEEAGSPDVAGLSAAARESAELAVEQDVTLEREVLAELDARGAADLWVSFADRADLDRAYEIDDWADQGRYVYDRLVETARASQARLTSGLATQGAEYESFWIANTVLVRGADQPVLDAVLAQPEVAAVRADEAIELPDPVEEASGEAGIAAVEWGIANIRADRVWPEFGRGQGIVVGNIDTGVAYTHPALVDQYRGNLGGGEFAHDYHWWDPSQVCPSDEPCDNHSHGTHTMGTMVGDDGEANQIGVAPGAQWIAAKGCESATCSQEALLSSGQFMLAPTNLSGGQPRPELRPHVVNNSWGGDPGQDAYDDMVAAWTAAGMFPAFSNGNSGPGCGTAGSPADGPDAYGVGAYDRDNQIAAFSSRGPGRDGEIRPHISAPGVDVRSAVPGGYGLASGTSMAAPHLAGTVALMWSASDLVGDIAATQEALAVTAVDTEDLSCGGTPGNNNVYGQGRLDAFEATFEVGIESGVTGTVTEAGSDDPLADVTVTVSGEDRERLTDADGGYTVRLEPGTYTLEFAKFGYVTRTVPDVAVTEQTLTTVDVGLELAPNGNIAGTVTDEVSGHGVPGVTMQVLDVPVDLSAVTDADGSYEIPGVPAETYQLQVTTTRPDQWWPTDPVEVTVTADATAPVDVGLPRAEGIERVSVSSDGRAGDDRSPLSDQAGVGFSADGRYVAFDSDATNLADVPTGRNQRTYVRDRLTGTTELVPEALWRPSSSDDGRYVTLDAPPGLTDEVRPPELPAVPKFRTFDRRTYLRDRLTGEVELVSVNSRGEAVDTNNTDDRAITPDGRYVTFTSGDPQLVDGEMPDCHTIMELWRELCLQLVVHDRLTGETDVVSVSSDGELANAPPRNTHAISADGRYVAFESEATNLVDEESDPDGDIFVHDRETGETEWVSVLETLIGNVDPDISQDGRFVAYTRHLQPAALYDRATGETELLTVPLDGVEPAFAASVDPHFLDGNRVAFAHVAFEDAPGGTVIPEATGFFVRDLDSGEVTRLGGGNLSTEFVLDVQPLAFSPDGGFALVSSEVAKRPDDTNGTEDLYLVDLAFDPDEPRARFAVWDLSVTPQAPEPGEPVEVTARVKNVGDVAGDYEAALLVDSVREPQATSTVRLAPGEGTEVTLPVSRVGGGTYQVRIGQAAGELRVQSGTLSGEVTDANEGLPVDGATVTATSGGTTRIATTLGGAYLLEELQLGTWTVTVEADNYVTETMEVTVTEDGQRLTRDVALRTGVAAAEPEALEVTVPAGSRATVDLGVANPGGADLAWRAYEWEATTGESPSILTYSWLIDTFRGTDLDTDIDRALQRLGLDYTGFRETEPCDLDAGPAFGEGMEKFTQALVDGEWDMVIVDHVCGLLEIPPRAAEAMTTHVTEGGSLILHSWQANPDWDHVFGDLWEAMGFQPTGARLIDPPIGVAFPVYWWEADHPVFTAPLAVPEYPPGRGILVDPLDDARGLAGPTLTARPDHASLVLGSDGRTLFRSFSTTLGFTNSTDHDGDGVTDAVELGVNSIVQVGGLSVRPWLEVDESGTLSPDGATGVTMSIDATHLEPGTHTGTVELVTDAAREPQVSVPVTVNVVGCDRTVSGTHLGRLTVSEGVTCLAEDSRVIGPVQVQPGAGLVATDAMVIGPVSATGATVVELRDTQVTGPVTVEEATGRVALAGSRVFGPVRLVDNMTGQTPIVVSGNRVVGLLACTGNQPPPVNGGETNRVTGPMKGQCAEL